MSIYKIFHFIFGKYTFFVERNGFERLLNLLSREGVRFWDAVPDGEEGRLCVSVFSAERVEEIAEKNGIIPKRRAGCGIPIIFARYRHRYGLYFGLLIGLTALLVSQLFLWKVTVSGNINVTKGEITKKLSELGIGVGSYIPSISPGNDANVLILEFDKLSSVALNIRGTHLFVEVLERTPAPETVDTTGFFNVVSSHDGIVLDIVASEGTPEVRIGETVEKGQLLINSFMEGSNGTFRPTHARGTVSAAVEQSFRVEVPLLRVQKQYTGRVSTSSVITLLGRELGLFCDKTAPFEYCDATVSEEELRLLGFAELPGKKTTVTFLEYVPRQTVISRFEAELIAREKLDLLLEETEGELMELVSEVGFDEKNGVCILNANATLKIDIGVEKPFFVELGDQKTSERFDSERTKMFIPSTNSFMEMYSSLW